MYGKANRLSSWQATALPRKVNLRHFRLNFSSFIILVPIEEKAKGRSKMGRLGHDPHIQHFSHLHLLELSNPQTLNTMTSCSACKLQPSGLMYTCKPCNFTLHVSCTQMPSSSPTHLTLLTLSPSSQHPSIPPAYSTATAAAARVTASATTALTVILICISSVLQSR